MFLPIKLSFLNVLYYITTIFQKMEVQVLATRISECIDDLGMLLDQIYRFPQKQREAYFQKIQSLKNKLLLLRGSLREGPLHLAEKQYKQLYLAMNTLKNDITLQSNALNAAKENREIHNRAKEAKEAKRNYEEAVKLLAEREDEIRQLRNQLMEKEEEISSADVALILEDNRRLQLEQTSLQLQLSSTKAAYERSFEEWRIREQEKDRAFGKAVEELERLKAQLIIAREKIFHFEQLAEVSIKKTRQVEQNIKKVQKQAQDLNENYRMKEHGHLKHLREMGELQYELTAKIEQNRQLDLHNRRLREDLQVLESEVTRLEKQAAEQRTAALEQREKLSLEKERLVTDIEHSLAREAELRHVLEEAQKKYLMVIAKLNVAEEFKARNRELQTKLESLQERLRRSESLIEETRKESLTILKQKERLAQQLESQMRVLRQNEIECFKHRQRAKAKEDQRIRVVQELQSWQMRLKESEKALTVKEVAFESLEAQLREQRSRTAKFEQRHRIKDKQMEGLKVKLLQAKIQAVHQIREVING